MTPDYGYGPGGFPAWGIPGGATLVFEVEILFSQLNALLLSPTEYICFDVLKINSRAMNETKSTTNFLSFFLSSFFFFSFFFYFLCSSY